MNAKLKKIIDIAYPKVVEQGKQRLGSKIDQAEGYIRETLPLLLTLSACICLQANFKKRLQSEDAMSDQEE